jgi:hypothetical protein
MASYTWKDFYGREDEISIPQAEIPSFEGIHIAGPH